ncbi:TonB-dependent receptor plug domain-containing protein [Roseateles koreensis]|uniref:TonB-dependent receptor n=1 Tax=Roseateles koreensis TaxID=2987526 RepID=A0ABT5KMB8_9BURK|nr:TonB-dependent receptor [Roseateles koreensis]MDC8784054.1 TonB-dependent receptor [Roseateles koreensis]
MSVSARAAPTGLRLGLVLLLPTLLPAWAQNAPAQTDNPPDSAASATQRPVANPKPKATAQLDRVDVSVRASDEDLRRNATAAKIVIGRDEIERFGDSSLGEVLKRLPGVSTGGRPGRGGEIRMRGMGNGYTQILVNGERMPPGFALDQLPPDQVERIEILRAPSAEYGARAVAGTINIVLREALQKRINDVRLGLGAERDILTPSVGWTRNDKLDDQGGAYNLSLNAQQVNHRDAVNTTALTHNLDGSGDSLLATQGQSEDERRSLNMSLRLQWKLPDGDALSLQPFMVAAKGKSSNVFDQFHSLASPGDFDHAQIAGDNTFNLLRLNSQWQHRINDDSKLELRGGLGQARTESHSLRQEFYKAALTRTQDDTTVSTDRSWSLNGKYSQQLANEHSLVAGLEGEGTTRTQDRACLQNGLACRNALEFGDDLSAATQRVALYGQDEWSVGQQWAFYAGIRGERIATRSTARNFSVSNQSAVWTPLLHAVWKFLDDKGKPTRDQIRASLTRSYRSPSLQDLIAQPTINAQYPCPDTQACGANAANYPDRSGNPNLKPELATGLDVAYESYLSKGGVLSANVFYRRISDLMRTLTTLQTVSYAAVPRWVSQPQNIGNASTMGLELEAKFRLDEFFDGAWPVSVRSNLSLFRSQVDGIPGPNNRLDQQPRGTANLGADYKLRSLPLSLGAGLNWTPAVTVQQSLLTEVHNSRKVVLDAFALWSLQLNTQLRLSATNLDPLSYANGNIINTGDQVITTNSGGRSYTLWQLRLEMKV